MREVGETLMLGHSATLLAYWYGSALRNVVRIPESGHSAKLLAYWYGAALRNVNSGDSRGTFRYVKPLLLKGAEAWCVV